MASATARSGRRSEEHTSELQSLMRISYAVFCLKKKKKSKKHIKVKQKIVDKVMENNTNNSSHNTKYRNHNKKQINALRYKVKDYTHHSQKHSILIHYAYTSTVLHTATCM